LSTNLADAYCGVAARWPDEPAIAAPAGNLTHRQMIERAADLAGLFRDRGLRPGDRIGVALTDNGEAFVAVLACWFCGASALILDFRTRAGERETLAGALGIRFVVQDRKAPGAGSYPALDVESGAS
jgi:acyl-CoA synthetase (AMP-forming)/AMP-acid ligase II